MASAPAAAARRNARQQARNEMDAPAWMASPSTRSCPAQLVCSIRKHLDRTGLDSPSHLANQLFIHLSPSVPTIYFAFAVYLCYAAYRLAGLCIACLSLPSQDAFLLLCFSGARTVYLPIIGRPGPVSICAAAAVCLCLSFHHKIRFNPVRVSVRPSVLQFLPGLPV